MNEFTSKELIYLKDGIALMLERCEMSASLRKELEELVVKLLKMISNYCEHIWSEGSGNIILCMKCSFFLPR